MKGKLVFFIIVTFIIGVTTGVFGYLAFVSKSSGFPPAIKMVEVAGGDDVYRNEKYGFEMKLTQTPLVYMVPTESLSFLEQTIYDFLVVKFTFKPEPVLVLSKSTEDINLYYFYDAYKNKFNVLRGADGPKIREITIQEFLQEYSSASLVTASDGTAILKITWDEARYMSASDPGISPYCMAGDDYYVLRPINIMDWFTNYKSAPHFYRFSLNYCSLKKPWLKEFTPEDRSVIDKVRRENTYTKGIEASLSTLKLFK